MKTTMRSYWARRVQRGAMWLDMTIPGWAKKINLPRFDIESPCDCIVGQTLGDYYACLGEFLTGNSTARDFGVCVTPDTGEQLGTTLHCRRFVLSRTIDIYDASWRVLDSLWREEIEQRQQLSESYGPESPRQRRARLRQRDLIAAGSV